MTRAIKTSIDLTVICKKYHGWTIFENGRHWFAMKDGVKLGPDFSEMSIMKQVRGEVLRRR